MRALKTSFEFRVPSFRFAVSWFVAAALGWIALSAPPAFALIKGEAVTLDYQVQNSDVILRGTCVDSATTWSNRHIVTTWKIVVKKYLKAPGKMSVETHPVLLVSQVGGRVSSPIPLDESYPEMAMLYGGEEVVLFLQSPERVPAGLRTKYENAVGQGLLKPSPLMTNWRLTTLSVSKLTVVKDSKTGTEVVTRINLDRYGILPSQEAAKAYVQALESQSRFLSVKRGGETIQIPIQVGKPVLDSARADATAAPSPSMDEKIQQMQSYTTTWDSFQQQVESVLRGEKSSAPSLVGGVKTSPAIRTIPPRKEQ